MYISIKLNDAQKLFNFYTETQNFDNFSFLLKKQSSLYFI